VRRLVRRVIHADRARGAGLVLDDDRLTPELRELLSEYPSHEVGASGGGIRHDQPHRFRWVGFRKYCATQQYRNQSEYKDEWSDDTHANLFGVRWPRPMSRDS